MPHEGRWAVSGPSGRGAARDLYDLWALDKVGALNAESAARRARLSSRRLRLVPH
jgi:hypothetical protein